MFVVLHDIVQNVQISGKLLTDINNYGIIDL